MAAKKLKLTTCPGMSQCQGYRTQQFRAIGKLFPGIELGYVGNSANGDMYFQQWGNPTPFILPAGK